MENINPPETIEQLNKKKVEDIEKLLAVARQDYEKFPNDLQKAKVEALENDLKRIQGVAEEEVAA